MKPSGHVTAGAFALGLLGVAAFLWWREAPEQTAPRAPVSLTTPLPATPAVASEPAATASAPAVLYPIEPVQTAEPPVAPLDVQAALTDLFGRKAVLSMFQLDGFARRLVATVDNLGRRHAPSSLWPVHPVPGRFLVERRDGVEVISPDNGLRYTPYVLLIEAVDLRKVDTIYRQLYPQLQRAYEEIGFPNRYFNDRLVEVIDQLLATPESETPRAVRLPEIKGPLQPERPWVLYEFDDPSLQQLSAGQRLLLRVGPVNQRRLKLRLAELRRLVSAGALPR